MSSLPVSDNPFEVLGVAKDVSDKDLKKRYFALLREFPPETHPDEFNRVQRAFEVLKDPEQRAQADKKEPYEDVAEPYRSRLREALEQLHGGQVDLARAALKTLVDENGELDDARNLLQQVYFNEEKYKEAEVQLAELVKRKSENTWYLYRHALVLNKLERHQDAHRASEAWVTASQGKDALAWEFIAETLAAQGRHDDAYRRLAEGLKTATQKAPLVLTRMHLRLDKLDKKGLEGDVKELLAVLPPNDDEQRGGAAQRLQSLAALYFSKTLPDEANLLLKTARELGGKGQSLQFPPRVEIFIEELPETSQQWIADETKAVHIFRVLRRHKAWDVVFALFFTAVWGSVALVSVMNESGWPGALAVFYGVVALGATAPLVWSWREVAWSFAVGHRRMVSVHPLYMLEVGVEKVVAWPLVNFNEPRIVHQFTNGAYTTSNVTLQFGKKKISLAIHGQQLAVDFANSLQQYRYRALQLLHGGLLEAEEGFDFIPHQHLEPGYRSQVKTQKRKARAKRWGYSAGVAALLAVAAAAMGSVREREKTWAAAVNAQSPEALAKALENKPGGGDALDAYRKTKIDAAKKSLEAALPATDPRRSALNVLLEKVQQAGRPLLTLRVKPMPLEGSTGAQASAFSNNELKAALGRFPQKLYDGFSQAMTLEARGVVAVSAGSASKGLPVEVALVPRLLERSVQVGKTRWPLLGLNATATMDGQVIAGATVELDAGDCAMLSSSDTATAVLDAQVDRLLAKAGAALAKSMGLGTEP